MHTQLTLQLHPQSNHSFTNYIVPNDDCSAAAMIDNLKCFATHQPLSDDAGQDTGHYNSIYIWGEHGCGKTHLLHACTTEAHQLGLTSIYVPLRDVIENSSELLDGLERNRLVCIDDVDSIVGELQWERRLFHLYNQARASGTRLVFAANSNPLSLGLSMSELTTRLGWGPVYQLVGMDQTRQISALQREARRLGFDLSDEVVCYLLNHYQRDNHSLFGVLQRLDELSLAQQRKVTVPLLKRLIEAER